MVIDLQLITDQSTWEDSLLYTMLLASGFKYQHINCSDFMLHSRDLKIHDKKNKEDGNQNFLAKCKWNISYIDFDTSQKEVMSTRSTDQDLFKECKLQSHVA